MQDVHALAREVQALLLGPVPTSEATLLVALASATTLEGIQAVVWSD